MTSKDKHISRRDLLLIGGGVLTASALGGAGALFLTQQHPQIIEPVTLREQEVDLTIRFLHSEPRLQLSDLQAAWTFDDGSGYTFRDISGQGHIAHLTGHNWNTRESGLTAAHHQHGKRGNAVYLNGACWLQAQHNATLNTTGQITVAAWIKLAAEPSALAWCSIIGKLQDNLGYTLLLGDKGNIRFSVRDERRTDHFVESGPDTITRDRWLHVAGTVDTAQGQLRLYLNGKLANSIDQPSFTPGNTNSDLLIGRSSWLQQAFNGWIDEGIIYKRALTEVEIHNLYITGLPTLYSQSRETIDQQRRVWSTFKGNSQIPHPQEQDTIFSLHFNGTAQSDQGQSPAASVNTATAFVPGYFGGAFNAATHPPLSYTSPIKSTDGTLEMWFIPTVDDGDTARDRKKVIFRAEGTDVWLELFTEQRRWQAAFGKGKSTHATLQSAPQQFPYESLVHLAVTWGQGRLALFVNGVEVAQTRLADSAVFDRNLILGGTNGSLAHGFIDDVRISNTVRSWGTICPRGHTHTETSALDLMDACNQPTSQPLFFWRSLSPQAAWRYNTKTWEDDGTKTGNDPLERQALYQATRAGTHALIHPDSYGYMSSIEAGISFAEKQDGWAGIFIQSNTTNGLSGYSFSLNVATNTLRLGIHQQGKLLTSKTLPYDFMLTTGKTYTLTLTSINDGVLRGYVDGNNLISWQPGTSFTQGYAGLFTEQATAFFDDIHFSALTPVDARSRRVQQRIFADDEPVQKRIGYDTLTLNAFRWHKRTGVLPWLRTTKDPQPAGCIFSADDGVPVPNPSAPWRSEDSANTDILSIDGQILLIMRGNPRFTYGHGPASLGVHHTLTSQFDGLHFVDPAPTTTDIEKVPLLRGRRDTAPQEMHDADYRSERFQVNDHGAAYVGNGEVLVFAREFRNAISPFPWYHRLIYGMYNVTKGTWQHNEAQYVEWSSMDPADTLNTFKGLDGTPDLVALRDPQTDEYRLFLFHEHKTAAGVPTTGITGLRFNAQRDQILLDPAYPTRETYTKPNADVIYGERVLFDNGIYYVHYNDATEYIQGDWPDRYALAASLHPYTQKWQNSMDTKRPYFQRGNEFDCDNGAIWGGQPFKHRGRYYMYYEAFHAIDDVNAPYQNYDHLQAGSRVCYATAN